MTLSNAERAATAEKEAKARAIAAQNVHDAANEEKTRMKAVYSSPLAVGARKQLASVLLKTDMTPEQILAALAAAPAGDKQAATPALEQSEPDPSHVLPPHLARIFDPQLMAAGEEAAKFLLNKK